MRFDLENNFLNKVSRNWNEEKLRIELSHYFNELDKTADIKYEETTTKGRTDMLFKDNIIELKAPGILSKTKLMEKAFIQARQYKNENIKKIYVFDGERLYALASNDQFNEISLNSRTLSNFAYNFLNNNTKLSFSKENVDSLLSPQKNKKLLSKLIENVNIEDSDDFKVWKELFQISAGTDASDDKSYLNSLKNRELIDIFGEGHPFSEMLFSLHTYFSIIVKLTITDTLSKMGILKKDNYSLKEIEDGDIFQRVNIHNFISKDLFSWATIDDELNDEINMFHNDVISEFNAVDPESFNDDFFNTVYESIIPHMVRKSLGEYYTPSDFAEKTMDFGNVDFTKKIIDPTCGSGTFVTIALNKKIESNLSLREIENSLAGIDINPVAILAAKANYLIRVTSIMSEGESVFIPIYNNDSTSINKSIKSFTNDIIEIENPDTLEKLRVQFSKIVSAETKGEFITLVDSFGPQIIRDSNHQILSKLATMLKDSSINTTERYKLKESILTSTIFDFDFIVGNPPWVKWSNLPSKYRESLHKKGVKEIFSPYPNAGGNSLDLYAPILWATSKNYLSNDGAIVMLMPMSLNYNSSLENVRKFGWLSGHKITKIHEFSSKANVFKGVKIDFGMYVINKDDDEVYLFSENRNSKPIEKYPHRNPETFTIIPFEKESDYMKVKKYLGYRDKTIKVRSGVQFSPNKYRQFVIDSEKDGILTLKSGPVRKVQKTGVEDIVLRSEKEAIVQIIRTANLKRDDAIKFYSWWAYEDGTKKELELSTIEKKYPILFESLNRIYDLIKKEKSSKFNERISKSNWWGNTRVGDYTQAPYRICFSDNGKFNPVLVTDIRLIPEGHVRFIPLYDKKEAERIFNILNKKEVKDLMNIQFLNLNKSFIPKYMYIKF